VVGIKEQETSQRADDSETEEETCVLFGPGVDIDYTSLLLNRASN